MIFSLSSHILLPILFATGLTAGTVDAIAGGGGLISLPILLGLGVPPHVALGTNKLQSVVGTSMATYSYYRHGLFELRKLRFGLIFTFIGAMSGALTAEHLSGDALRRIIPILLIFILLYVVFSPRLGNQERQPKIREATFYVIFGTLLGFYDGFLGPGVGAFWVFLLMYFLGHNLVKATAYTKAFNVNTNFVALMCFSLGHNVDYRIGLCMAAGQIIGGRLGARLAIKKGAKLIRPLFIVVVSATIVTLIYRNYGYELNLNHNMLHLAIVSVLMLIGATSLFWWNNKRKMLQENK